MLLPKKMLFLSLALLGLLLLTGTGCATKKFVKKQIDPVSGRVDELTEVSKRNENAIKDVDSRAQAGIQSVQTKANEVDQRAITANQKAEQAQQLAQNNQTQISSVETTLTQKINNIDSYKPVDTTTVRFKFNKADLTDEARAALDQMASKIKDARGYVLEIQGFTDKTGTENYNLALSQRRSESVVRYLSQQHQIPLFRMYVLGLGAAKPAEQGRGRNVRAANRRVEVTLLRNENEGATTGAAGATGTTTRTGQSTTPDNTTTGTQQNQGNQEQNQEQNKKQATPNQ